MRGRHRRVLYGVMGGQTSDLKITDIKRVCHLKYGRATKKIEIESSAQLRYRSSDWRWGGVGWGAGTSNGFVHDFTLD